MQTADSKRTSRKVVASLVVAAAVIWTAGLNYKKKQHDATIDWHHVSTALMEVEGAKRELHLSLQERISREQQVPSLRRQ